MREHFGNLEKQFRYTWLQRFLLLVNVSHYWCSEKHEFRIEEPVHPSRGLYFACELGIGLTALIIYEQILSQGQLCSLPFS